MDEIINRLKKVRRGAMFIIEAPSGTGKSAVVKEILKRDSNIKFSVSVTTRKPRENEVDGVDGIYLDVVSFTGGFNRFEPFTVAAGNEQGSGAGYGVVSGQSFADARRCAGNENVWFLFCHFAPDW